MNTARPHVTNRYDPGGRNLLCRAQIPLHYIATLRVVFHIGGTKTGRTGGQLCVGERWKRTLSGLAKELSREGERVWRNVSQLIWQGEYIEHSETAAQEGPGVLGRRPCKPEARLQIVKRRVQKVR